jgi:hypothetical protein
MLPDATYRSTSALPKAKRAALMEATSGVLLKASDDIDNFVPVNTSRIPLRNEIMRMATSSNKLRLPANVNNTLQASTMLRAAPRRVKTSTATDHNGVFNPESVYDYVDTGTVNAELNSDNEELFYCTQPKDSDNIYGTRYDSQTNNEIDRGDGRHKVNTANSNTFCQTTN